MQIIDSTLHLPGTVYKTPQLKEALSQKILLWTSKLPAGASGEREDIFNDLFFERLGVAQRHLVVDPANPDRWWSEHQGESPIAREGAQAYLKLMNGREPLSTHDRLIVVSNVFDTTAPGLGVTLLACLAELRLEFISPSILPISGDGCSGFISAMHEAEVWLRAHPGTRVVIISCEISSPYFWSPILMKSLEDAVSSASSQENQERLAQMIRGLFIQRLLFGDGCVAALCVDDHAKEMGIPIRRFHRWSNLKSTDRHLLKIIGMGTELGSFPSFGFFAQQPKNLTARLLADYLPRVRGALDSLERRPSMFAIHAGSGSILDCVQSSLSLTASEVEPSRAVLRQYGNLNSATGAAIIHALRLSQSPQDIFCVFFGVGFTMQVASP